MDALVETVDGLIQGSMGARFAASTVTATSVSSMRPFLSSMRPFSNRERDVRMIILKRRIVSETQLRLKLRSGAPITPQEVISCENQTLKHRALVACGYERFVAEVGATTIDVDGEGSLLRIEPGGTGRPIMFVYVKDATGDKRYLLRVPPTMSRVREAIAWTFGMREREYKPIVET